MNFYNDMVADGRTHRLSKCNSLAEALSSCMSQRESALKALQMSEADKKRKASLSESSSGGWSGWLLGGLSPTSAASAAASTPGSGTPVVGGREEAFASIPTCIKEENVTWHCRALAYGCGGEVLTLKRCSEAGGGKFADRDCAGEQKSLMLCVRKGRDSHADKLSQQKAAAATQGN